ncbi:hypothetical protein D3C81_922740 [compost metagenome]
MGEAKQRLTHLAQLQGAGEHAADRLAQAAGQVGLPVTLVRLRAGHGDAQAVAGQDEYAVAMGECWRYQPVDLRQVELQWVDTLVRLPDFSGEPLAQAVQMQPLAGVLAVFEAQGRYGFERMARWL